MPVYVGSAAISKIYQGSNLIASGNHGVSQFFGGAPAAPSDPFWANVSLLLPMDSSFADASSNALVATVSGDSQISSAESKFGGASGYFDDTGDRLTFAASPLFTFGTGDYTVETHILILPHATNNQVRILSTQSAGSNFSFEIMSSGTLRMWTGSNVLNFGGNVTRGVWHHVAFCRASGTIRAFVDGVIVGGPTANSTNMTNTQPVEFPSTAAYPAPACYLDNFRVTKAARYTATFTPPTAPHPIPPDPYFNKVSLLLPMDSSFADESSNAISVTANGNAQISTAESKFGGASGLFDGAGDFLSMTNASLPLGTGDFTIEGWLYRLGNTGESIYRLQNLVTSRPSESTSTACYDVLLDRYNNAATPKLAFGRPGAIVCSGGSVTNNTWHHVAVVRSSGTATVYLNGQAVGSGSASTINDTQQSVWIAGKPGSNLGQFPGYLDDWRITKGIARYTSNFTPPTAPFPTS